MGATDMWICQCIVLTSSSFCLHTHSHKHILIPFEDHELRGLKVDIAWVTVSIYGACFEYTLNWSTDSAVRLLHSWSHVKLLLSQCMLCVHHSTMHQFTASLHSKPHTQGACVFSCNLPSALWQNDQHFLCATAVTQGWNGYWSKSQHRKLTQEKIILLPLLPGLECAPFWSQILHSITELSPFPHRLQESSVM